MEKQEASKNPLKEITQPFIDLVHAPRALWGINLPYFFEGFVYFGILGYLAMYFSDYVGLNDHMADIMVGVLTWGITFSMFLFGGLADKWGVRRALLIAFVLMIGGRAILAGGSYLGLTIGLWSPLFWVSMLGILLITLGYGMYQPAAYAAVRQFTTPKTAAMGYAMLYALMNLGGWLPTFFSPVRKAIGIPGAFWVYTGITVLALLSTWLILSKRVVRETMERIKAETGVDVSKEDDEGEEGKPKEPFSLIKWFKNHPLADPKFSFFIFCLIPVQTLFAHNWLTLPMYVARAYQGTWIGDNFEVAVNFNPLLIFILVPIVTAVTQKRNVYNMMIAGTFVMALPTFLLALGPSFWTLLGYLVLMTIGEAMWQPRFLQYAAEIAPKGRTGAYMGVAQFPWFLTKVVTSLYAGWFLANYCPKEGKMDTEFMWFVYGLIAISSTVMLILARGWVGKDFKTKADD
ncbi:MAG: MFS transporter [Deltaproteobacteria bacterium]|nr:MFS transporter [Deltaproteobacteria bacterium]